MGGGLGLGPITEAVSALATVPNPNLKVTVVCGRNEPLRSELATLLAGDPRVQLLGETDRVSELMREADLLVSKPGGITCCEALASGLPILLLAPLPGQEEENVEALLLTGAAQVARAEDVGQIAAHLLWQEPARLKAMRNAALVAGRPSAARTIATTLLGTMRGAQQTGS
jgi:processive 1,2-diacylglycerol beta-glucosyltransferase